jgi:tRNA(fMet)-specific endonuclease VapC
VRYLLDTCVISELVKKNPEPKVVAWVDAVPEETLLLSAITIGEIRKGIEKVRERKRKADLERWLSDELLVRFRGQILPLDEEVMLTCGRMLGQLEAKGRSLPAINSLIAALARHHRLTLVTRNVKDFKGCGIELLNPWE